MSIHGQSAKIELPVNLKIIKRNGPEEHKGGKIMVQSEKAVLVFFEEEEQGCWIGKRNMYDNKDHYGVTANMGNRWQRVSLKSISELEKYLHPSTAEERLNDNHPGVMGDEISAPTSI